MSVAIIHELAQPLSMLAVEAKNLRAISRSPEIDRQELSAAAHLIERKSTGLAELARRLRGFGAWGADEFAPLDVDKLLRDVAEVVQPAAKAAGVRLRVETAAASVGGNGLELQQVFVNLLRNAVVASAGEEVMIAARRTGASVVVHIDNPLRAAAEDPQGMGIGLIIARAIVEAHGGELMRQQGHGGMRYTVRLPLDGGRHAE